MLKLINILFEDSDKNKKESMKKRFPTYSCYFIVKFKKKVNRIQAVERIRGIKSVTIVDLRGDEKLEKINNAIVDYEYSSVEVKFVTDKNPKDQVEYIRQAMIRSDRKSNIPKIPGIVGAKARIETLKRIK